MFGFILMLVAVGVIWAALAPEKERKEEEKQEVTYSSDKEQEVTYSGDKEQRIAQYKAELYIVVKKHHPSDYRKCIELGAFDNPELFVSIKKQKQYKEEIPPWEMNVSILDDCAFSAKCSRAWKCRKDICSWVKCDIATESKKLAQENWDLSRSKWYTFSIELYSNPKVRELLTLIFAEDDMETRKARHERLLREYAARKYGARGMEVRRDHPELFEKYAHCFIQKRDVHIGIYDPKKWEKLYWRMQKLKKFQQEFQQEIEKQRLWDKQMNLSKDETWDNLFDD